ncbi:hypothetical protein NPIL_287811 [Nephila pilipes]|uniref:Uncharacterized protein n=1 Tax=Nephila pilipes TaxID=299642 RepID=A0A8X6NNJ1_NEPPI|nr:hypothetical protein NPIL_287811 [Nephila pilipes]
MEQAKLYSPSRAANSHLPTHPKVILSLIHTENFIPSESNSESSSYSPSPSAQNFSPISLQEDTIIPPSFFTIGHSLHPSRLVIPPAIDN